MNKVLAVGFAIFLSPFFVSAQQTNAGKTPHKVVIQLSSSDTLAWK